MNGQLLLIEPSAVRSWVDKKMARLDIDHAASHAKLQQETEDPREAAILSQYQLYESDKPVTQSEFRSRAVVAGDIAIIPIHNEIEYRPTIWSDYGYMCSSLAIKNDIERLAGDDSIRRIVLDIDSPGGDYVGTPETAKAIFAARSAKEIIAVSNPLSASGALWLGTAATKFYSLGSGQVGSIGALMVHSDFSQYYTSLGITNTIIRSPEHKADFNSIEPLADDVKAYYQERIDAIAAEFIETVAKHRGVSKKVVAETYGGGRMLTARQALPVGMIDGVVDSLESLLGVRVKAAKRIRLNPAIEAAKARGLRKKVS